VIRQDRFEDIEETDLFVGRISANVLDESNVGIILTDGDPHSNLDSSTVGADFRYRNTRLSGGRQLEGEAWYQQSDTEGIEEDNRAYGFGVESPNNTGWRGGVSAKQIEENFDPAIGFVNETGIRDYSAEGGYRHRFDDAYLRSVYGSVEMSRTERLDTGELDRERLQFGFNLDNSTQDRMFTNFSQNKENVPFDFPIYVPSDGGDPVVIPAGDYSWSSMVIGLRSGNQRKVSAFIGMGTGEYFDGESTNINTDIDWRPSSRLRLGVSYSVRDIDLPGGSFVVRQSSLTAQFVFSSTLSWVNLIQYDNFSEVVGFNSRLHWIPEAGREGFLVFNHSIADPDKNDSFHSTYADVAVKFSYTWRF
jgi:hypothetical protein